MQNKANFRKSQMFITVVSTMDYNEKLTMDTWSKQTQTKPIYSEPVEPIKLPSGKEFRCTAWLAPPKEIERLSDFSYCENARFLRYFEGAIESFLA